MGAVMGAWEPKWKPIAVDGEPFEWSFTEGVIAHLEHDGPELEPEKTFLILMRRPGVDANFTAVEWKGDRPPGDSDVEGAVRSRRDKLATTADPMRGAQRHANKLHMEWNKLPLVERIELSRLWLERWERTNETPPQVKDPSNLHDICVKLQLHAHVRGVTELEEERAAQERDVRAALDRMPKTE